MADDSSPDGLPPAKRTKPSLDTNFDVLVDTSELQNQKRFTLHINLFIPRSAFFKAARSAAWNTDPLKPTILDDEDQALDNAHVKALIKMWVLADKFGDLETANLVMHRFVEYCTTMDEFPTISCFNLAYNSTAKGSPLRSFLCALVLCQDSAGDFDDPKDLPAEFFQDMAIELSRMMKELFFSQRTVKRVIGVNIPDLTLSRWYLHDGEKRTPSSE